MSSRKSSRRSSARSSRASSKSANNNFIAESYTVDASGKKTFSDITEKLYVAAFIFSVKLILLDFRN